MVVVYFRDVAAKEKYDQKITTLEARYANNKKKLGKERKNVKREGLAGLEEDLVTLGGLKQFVLEKLKDHPVEEGVTLEMENIGVFSDAKNAAHGAGDLGLVQVEGDDATPLDGDATYVALEVFTIVPVDIYRTVKIRELRPMTPCRLAAQTGFTKVSPLMTAAMTPEEQRLPWCVLKKQHNSDGIMVTEGVEVNGMSVFCKDNAIAVTDDMLEVGFDPTTELVNGATGGETRSLTLDQYRERCVAEENVDELVGFLESSASHGVSKVRPGEYLGVRKSKVSSQLCMFRFKLCAGTDLGEHGMVLVCDNLGDTENHCTIVWNENPTGERRKWVPTNPFLPQVLFPVFLESPVFKNPKDLSDNEVDTMQLPLPREECGQPETQDIAIDQADYLSFPCLAAMFKLHDFVMHARPEPLPLESSSDNSEDAASLYHAILVLFNAETVTEDTYDGIQMLGALGYETKYVDSSVPKLILQAMKNVREDQVDGMEIEALGGVEPSDALWEGIEILGRLMVADEEIAGVPSEPSDDESAQTACRGVGDLAISSPYQLPKMADDVALRLKTPTAQSKAGPAGAAEDDGTPESRGTDTSHESSASHETSSSHSTAASKKTSSTMATLEDQGYLDSLLPERSSSNEGEDPLEAF